MSLTKKKDEFFPELMKYKEDRGNIVANMRSRIIYTHKFAKLQEPYIPVDFRKYKEYMSSVIRIPSEST